MDRKMVKNIMLIHFIGVIIISSCGCSKEKLAMALSCGGKLSELSKPNKAV